MIIRKTLFFYPINYHLSKQTTTERRNYIMSQLLKKVGSNVRLYRRKKNLTQKKLAEKSGIHQTYLSRIENGRINIFLTTLIKIARALETRPRNLVK